MTLRRATRSRTLPSAPPRIRAMPNSPRRPPARPVTSSHARKPITATEKRMSKGESQGERDSANRPNATPGFVVWTKFRTLGTRTRCEPSEVYFSIANLLAWSAASAAKTTRPFHHLAARGLRSAITILRRRWCARFHRERRCSARRLPGIRCFRRRASNNSSNARISGHPRDPLSR